MNYDPYTHTRELYRENLWLRDTLKRVAEDLEHQAAAKPPNRDKLLGRAMRIRKRLFEGVPEGWSGS